MNFRYLLDNFKVKEGSPFGQVMAPIIVTAKYDGSWGTPQLAPYGPLEILPGSKALHYAEEIFEGMKAYATPSGPSIFRPLENLARFNRSAARLVMPEIDEYFWLEGISMLTNILQSIIPQDEFSALYLRPTMIAISDSLGITSDPNYLFFIIANPFYYNLDSYTLNIFIERSHPRAFPGGTGNVKTGGNYAAATFANLKAKGMGFNQVLWLDAINRKYIEEFSSMNFFMIKDDILYTPELTDTILPGITRKSIIQLAKHLGMKVKEERIDVDMWLLDIENSKCSEAFACGTANHIVPITKITDGDKSLSLTPGPLTRNISTRLLSIQNGRTPDIFNWNYLTNNRERAELST
jgi:branched-chain amino acid aminotransferase